MPDDVVNTRGKQFKETRIIVNNVETKLGLLGNSSKNRYINLYFYINYKSNESSKVMSSFSM
jgi:hypothetical protein